MKKQTILVTGGAGFIGSHLSEELLRRGKKVVVLDDLSTGSKGNIRHLLKNPCFKFVKGSVLEKKLLESLIKSADFVYHLAAAVGAKTVVEKPLHSFLVNLNGTELILELASKNQVPVLLTSSSEVYGKGGKLPFAEDDDRVYGSVYNMRWGYAFSKGADEFLALAYWLERRLPVVVVRLFNVIGPRQTGAYGMVVPRFVQQALANKPITIYGDGRQTRSFADVKDAVRGMIGLAECQKAFGQVVNLGSDEEISIGELAKRIKTLTGSSSQFQYVPFETVYGKHFAEMMRRRPNLAKIKELIGYRPLVSLEESLISIIREIRKN